MTSGIKRKNGLIDNKVFGVPGYTFYTQTELVDLISKCGFEINYIEKFSRAYTPNRENINKNEMWKNVTLDVNESWYAICATKID